MYCNKVLLACDPSYSRTGLAAYYGGKIIVSEVRGKDIVPEFQKSFEGIYHDSSLISKAIEMELGRMLDRLLLPLATKLMITGLDYVMISECPPPQGSYAPGLYALDIRMFEIFGDMCTDVFRVYPNYLMHIHGKRNYQKSESVTLARRILEDYDVEILSSRLSHDESEAVIFLSRLLYKEGLLSETIVQMIPNIKNEKEALFVYE